jgi:hypothetical protein
LEARVGIGLTVLLQTQEVVLESIAHFDRIAQIAARKHRISTKLSALRRLEFRFHPPRPRLIPSHRFTSLALGTSWGRLGGEGPGGVNGP